MSIPAESKNISITGSVLDQQGKPIAGAELQLVTKSRWYKNEFDLTYESCTAGPNGTFIFPSVDFVQAWIIARYRPNSKAPWIYTETEPFEQGGDDKLERAVRFSAKSPTVSGTVKDECNNPVVGAIVSACPEPGHCFTTPYLMRWRGSDEVNSVSHLSKSYLPMSVSDHSGNFSITGMPAGKYTLLAAAENYKVYEHNLGFVPQAKLTRHDVSLKTASNPGNISLGGRAVDAEGVGVGELTIVAIDSAGMERRVESTAKNGSFLLTNLAAGKWSIAVKSPGPGGQKELARTKAYTSTDTAIELRIPTTRIEGRVLLPEGKPLTSTACVELDTGYSTYTRKLTTSPQQGGRFIFTRVPPGPVTLRATVRGYREAVKSAVAGKTEPVDLVVAPECTLAVRVLEERTGEPLSDVDIEIGEMINNEMHWRNAGTTDGDGWFKDTRVRPGQTQVRARNPGATHAARSIITKPGKNEPIMLTLSRPCKIDVAVFNADGKPATGTNVSYEVWPVTRFLGIEYDGSVGCYRRAIKSPHTVMRVPPGEYNVRAIVRFPKQADAGLMASTPSEMLTPSERLRIANGQSANVSLKLGPRKSFRPFVLKVPPPPVHLRAKD
ncbi:MAG TPA: carboxypeptidase-like regulatory domain-containing protein [Candidatus Obscuribacterales bacterium]